MADIDKAEKRFLAIFNTIRGNGPEFFAATGSVMLAVHPLGANDRFPERLKFVADNWFFFAALGLFVLAIIFYFWRGDSYGTLAGRERALKSKYQKISHDLIKILREQIKHLLVQEDLDTATNRISLYRHADGCFHLLARYSKNPTYQAIGRQTYPDDQGIIGQCWSHGKGYVGNLPANEAKWVERAAEKYYIPPGVSENFAMKSRSLMGVRLDCGETGSIPTGVIIIESMVPEVSAAKVDDLAGSQMVDLITRTLQVSIQSLPNDGREAIKKISTPHSSQVP